LPIRHEAGKPLNGMSKAVAKTPWPVRKDQYNLLAMMIIEGWPHQDIADAMTLGLPIVKRFATGKGPPGFNVALDELRQKFSNAVVRTHFDFIDMQNRAVEAISDALDSSDKRLAAEQAWKVLDVVSPRPKDGGISVSMNLTQNNQVNAQMADISLDLMKTFKELKKLPLPSYEKHMKTGLEGLPDPMQRTIEEAAENDALDAIEAEYSEVPEGAPAEEQPDV